MQPSSKMAPDSHPAPPWEALGNTPAGVQSSAYPDSPRKEIYPLFSHAPRRVLDIGCAAGGTGAGLKQQDPAIWVWGNELNEHAARQAASRLDHVTTRPLEAWGESEFALLKTLDTVLLLDVLEHMVNPWQALSQLAREAAPDTQFIISLPNIRNIHVIRDLVNGYWHYKPWGILDITHLRFFTEYEMWKMFHQTGFRVEASSSLSFSPFSGEPAFPLQLDLGNLQLRVENEAHLQSLLTVQFGFRLRVCPDAQLNAEEHTMRHSPHPPTHAF